MTKKGREILKNGGNLNISSFTMSDTGVDYTLWNPDHPSGSAFYGEAIENLPQLEASVHAEYNLRNRLISLNQNTVAIPALQIAGTDGKGLTTLTLEEGRLSSRITLDLVGFTSTRGAVNNPYYVVVQDPSLVTISGGQLQSTLSGTSRIFLEEQDIPFAQEFSISGATFGIRASQQDTKGKQTNIYIVHVETGAYNSFTVVNNVTRDKRAILATNIQN